MDFRIFVGQLKIVVVNFNVTLTQHIYVVFKIDLDWHKFQANKHGYTFSNRLLISRTGTVTAAKTKLPNLLFSDSGVLIPPFMTSWSCSMTRLTAESNGTWKIKMENELKQHKLIILIKAQNSFNKIILSLFEKL